MSKFAHIVLFGVGIFELFTAGVIGLAPDTSPEQVTATAVRAIGFFLAAIYLKVEEGA